MVMHENPRTHDDGDVDGVKVLVMFFVSKV